MATDLAPASLALTLVTPGGGAHLGRSGPHTKSSSLAAPFCVPLGHAPGVAGPQGVSLGHVATPTGVAAPEAVLNFAVASRSAKQMVLYLQWGTDDDDASGELELALDPGINRTGHMWHIAVPVGGPAAVVPWGKGAPKGGLRYGWRAGGGGMASMGRVCVDPYAGVLVPPAFPPPCPPGMVPPPALGDVPASLAVGALQYADDGATGPALGVRPHHIASRPCASGSGHPSHMHRLS